MPKLNPLKYIKGKLPKKMEIADWKESDFLNYIEFVKHFLERDNKGFDTMRVTKLRIEEAEEHEEWAEYIARIDKASRDPRSFFYRFNAMSRTVLTFLKQTPAYITEKIRESVQESNRLNWCLSNFKIQTTETGQDIIVPDNFDNLTNVKTPMKGKEPEKMFLEVVVKVTSILQQIAGSITKKEINELKTMDKISALSKLSFIMNTMKGYKPNSGIFTQLNVYGGGRQELEKSLTSWMEANQRENEQ